MQCGCLPRILMLEDPEGQSAQGQPYHHVIGSLGWSPWLRCGTTVPSSTWAWKKKLSGKQKVGTWRGEFFFFPVEKKILPPSRTPRAETQPLFCDSYRVCRPLGFCSGAATFFLPLAKKIAAPPSPGKKTFRAFASPNFFPRNQGGGVLAPSSTGLAGQVSLNFPGRRRAPPRRDGSRDLDEKSSDLAKDVARSSFRAHLESRRRARDPRKPRRIV